MIGQIIGGVAAGAVGFSVAVFMGTAAISALAGWALDRKAWWAMPTYMAGGMLTFLAMLAGVFGSLFLGAFIGTGGAL